MQFFFWHFTTPCQWLFSRWSHLQIGHHEPSILFSVRDLQVLRNEGPAQLEKPQRGKQSPLWVNVSLCFFCSSMDHLVGSHCRHFRDLPLKIHCILKICTMNSKMHSVFTPWMSTEIRTTYFGHLSESFSLDNHAVTTLAECNGGPIVCIGWGQMDRWNILLV